MFIFVSRNCFSYMSENSIIKSLKITAIIHETNDAKTFVLEPLDGWQPVYKAGQFLTLIFTTRHGEKRRSYSISSSPTNGEPLSITVKRIENGEFSRLLIQHAKVGDIFYTPGISGVFTLPEDLNPQSHFVFLAAGSGITPCFSLIKTLLMNSKNKITLIYSNKNNEDIIFYKTLSGLQQTYPDRFQIRFLLGNSNDVYNKRLSKWLLEQLLDQYVGTDFDTVLFYLCGPFEYMQMAEVTLMIRSKAEHIIKENFSSFPRLKLPEPPDTTKHAVTIHINSEVYTLDVQYPQSILAAAKEKKIVLPYSCEAGRCSSCVATCSKGEVWMAYNEVLVDKEVKKGRILVCQSYPVYGDVELVYD